MSHWSSGLPVCFPSWGSRIQSLGGYLCENRILLLALSHYIHWWPPSDWSLWPRLRRASSQTVTRLSCRQCDNPTWSHTALLSWFHALCRASFQFHNRHSRLLGGSPVESLQSHCRHTMSHWFSGLPVCFLSWGTRIQSPGGYLCETRIRLLALSRYSVMIIIRLVGGQSHFCLWLFVTLSLSPSRLRVILWDDFPHLSR
jgi:hypothetical protein